MSITSPSANAIHYIVSEHTDGTKSFKTANSAAAAEKIAKIQDGKQGVENTYYTDRKPSDYPDSGDKITLSVEK
jgi:hypothetical protein